MPLIHGFCRLVDLRNLFRAPRAIAISAQVDLETAETPETRETPNTEVKAPGIALTLPRFVYICVTLCLDLTEIGGTWCKKESPSRI